MFGGVGYRVSKSFLTEFERESLRTVGRSVAASVHGLLSNAQREFSGLTASHEFRVAVKKHQFSILPEYLARSSSRFSQLVFADSDGFELVKIVDGNPDDNLGNLANQEVFGRAMDSAGGTYVSPLRHPTGIEPYVEFGQEVIDFFDTTLGVVIGRVPVHLFASPIRDIVVGETGFVLLVDAEGHVVYGSESSLGFLSRDEDSRSENPPTVSITPDSAEFGSLSIGDTRGFAALIPLKNTGLTIAVAMPADEFLAGPVRMRNLLIGLTAGALVFSVLFALLVAGAIDRPVRRLVAASRSLAQGNFSERVPVETRDEIGALADSFNRMAEDLSKITVSREFVTNVIESVPSGIFVTGPGGLIRTINRQAQAMAGYTDREIDGLPVAKIFAGDRVEPLITLIGNDTLSSGEMILRDTSLICKSGERIPVMLSVAPLHQSGGALAGYVLVAVDLTERIQSEQTTRDLMSQLAHAARLSTMGEMAAGFAHELNQPLGAISNYANGLLRIVPEDRDGADELRPIFRRIADQSRRASEVIRRIRQFVGNGRMGGVAFDFNEAIREITDLLQPELVKNRISLVVDLDEALASITADPIPIQQVVLNLMRNTMEAMGETESPQKSLRIKTERTATGVVRVTVSDTGPGMPPNVARKIFFPFFTTKPSGMGMGLSICESLMASQGGSLRFETQEGVGTTFWLTVSEATEPAEEAV